MTIDDVGGCSSSIATCSNMSYPKAIMAYKSPTIMIIGVLSSVSITTAVVISVTVTKTPSTTSFRVQPSRGTIIILEDRSPGTRLLLRNCWTVRNWRGDSLSSRRWAILWSSRDLKDGNGFGFGLRRFDTDKIDGGNDWFFTRWI